VLVCALGRSDRAPTDPVKTDKRDAIRLARGLAAGELTFVTVPSIEHEQLRDLVRCRDDIRMGLMRAGHRLGKFLLRREIYYDRLGEPWGRKHRIWLASLRFSDQASRLTMADYMHAHDVPLARRDRIESELEQLASESIFAQTIARLRCLRGIGTLSAVGICAEVGEFERFDHPDSLAAYLGIVPSGNTTGQQRRQGSITKAGSTHGRRLSIEAAYHYQRFTANGEKIQRRREGQPARIINVAWRAQRGLNARWRQLKHQPREPNGVVAVAIARELAACCWEIALAD
jgi:transposase